MMYFSRIRLKSNIGQSSNLHHLMKGNGYGVHQLLWELFPGQKQRPFIFREEIAGEQLGYRSDIKGEPVYYMVSRQAPLSETALFTTDSRPYSPRLKTGDRLAFKLRANPVVARKEAGKKNSVKHDIVMDAQRNLLIELATDMNLSCKDKKSVLKQEIFAAWQTSRDQRTGDKLCSLLSANERFAGYLTKRNKPDRLLYWAIKACADKALEEWLNAKGHKNGFRVLRNEKSGLLHFQAEGYQWHALPRKGRNAGFSSVDFDGVLEVCDPEVFIDALYKGIGSAKGFGCGLMIVRRI